MASTRVTFHPPELLAAAEALLLPDEDRLPLLPVELWAPVDDVEEVLLVAELVEVMEVDEVERDDVERDDVDPPVVEVPRDDALVDPPLLEATPVEVALLMDEVAVVTLPVVSVALLEPPLVETLDAAVEALDVVAVLELPLEEEPIELEAAVDEPVAPELGPALLSELEVAPGWVESPWTLQAPSEPARSAPVHSR